MAVRGIDAVTPDSLLLMRAREVLSSGPVDAVSLMERVCSLPSAPPRVAERLAEALFGRHADFVREADGRWALRPDGGPARVRGGGAGAYGARAARGRRERGSCRG